MKKIKFFLIIPLLTGIHSFLSAQNIQNFLGVYDAKVICTVHEWNDYQEYYEYELKIIPSTDKSYDVQFYVPNFPEIMHPDTIRALVSGDTYFVAHQKHTNEYDDFFSSYFYAEVSRDLITDSIIMIYRLGSPSSDTSSLECDCRGKRKSETAIQSLSGTDTAVRFSNAANTFYINPLTEPLLFELFDFSGVVIVRKTVGLNEDTIDVGGIASGIYFYQLSKNGQKTDAGKIIKP